MQAIASKLGGTFNEHAEMAQALLESMNVEVAHTNETPPTQQTPVAPANAAEDSCTRELNRHCTAPDIKRMLPSLINNESNTRHVHKGIVITESKMAANGNRQKVNGINGCHAYPVAGMKRVPGSYGSIVYFCYSFLCDAVSQTNYNSWRVLTVDGEAGL